MFGGGWEGRVLKELGLCLAVVVGGKGKVILGEGFEGGIIFNFFSKIMIRLCVYF